MQFAQSFVIFRASVVTNHNAIEFLPHHALQILTTVNEGVVAKGMPAWGQVLKPDEVTAVVAYVTTLRGTNPANAKAPQGDRAVSESAATSADSAKASP